MAKRHGLARPPSVRHSVQLVAACAVLNAAGVAAAIVALRQLSEAAPAYVEVAVSYGATRASAEGMITGLHSSLIMYAVICGASVALLAPLSVALWRPWQAARIAAWTVAGILIPAHAVMIVVGPDLLTLVNGSEPPEVRAAQDALLPGWYADVTGLLTSLLFVGMAAYVLLLLRTSARDFYIPLSHDGPAALWTYARRDLDGEPLPPAV